MQKEENNGAIFVICLYFKANIFIKNSPDLIIRSGRVEVSLDPVHLPPVLRPLLLQLLLHLARLALRPAQPLRYLGEDEKFTSCGGFREKYKIRFLH